MPFYCHDYMRDERVIDMTPVGRSVYVELLCSSWSMGGSLPNRSDHLWKYTLLNTKEEWDAVSVEVLSMFKVVDERLVNPRLSEEFKQSHKIAQGRINAGKLGAEARYGSGTASSGANGTASGKGVEHNINITEQNKKPKTMQGHVSESEVASSSALLEPKTQGPASGPSDAAARVAEKLAAILGRDDLKPRTKIAWAEQVEVLVTAHGEKTVMDVMQYALVDNPDGFWRGRIYAAKNFVRCFNTVHKQAQRKDAGTRKAAADPLVQRAASLQSGHDFSAMAKGDV